MGSGARGRRQLLPPPPGSPGLVAPRDGRGPAGHIGGRAAAPLLTWRSLGPGWGIRRVRASPRAPCAPARRRPPAPALAAALALHGARGWPGPREACPVGGGSSGSRSSPMAPRLPPPRVRAPFLCGRPFPSARQDRPNWFLRCGVVPLVSFQQPQLGRGRARPSALPRSLPGAERSRTPSPETGRRGPGPVPSPVRSGGRWAPWPRSERVPRLARAALASSDAPASLGTRLPPRPVRPASLSRCRRLARPPPGVGDRASPESWRGRSSTRT